MLLYKDARVDQNILDETVGPMNWQRHHSRENANCVVALWDKEKQQWIEKEDTGTESRADGSGNEKKGLASDSFKRACFNWGIGRELYSAPFIWISCNDFNSEMKNGKHVTYDSFSVKDIEYDGGNISKLSIQNNKTKRTVFTYGKKDSPKKTSKEEFVVDVKGIKALIKALGLEDDEKAINTILENYHVSSLEELTKDQVENLYSRLKATTKESK